MRWVQTEVESAALGDLRLKHRLGDLLAQLADHAGWSVPRACGDWAATKAAYRFFANARVAPSAIAAAHRQATLDRLRSLDRVLILTDTTSFDFTPHPATAGLGPLETRRRFGFFCHTALAVSTAGLPQGVLAQANWTRDPETWGQAQARRERPAAEKESARWQAVEQAATADWPVALTDLARVVIADAEGDIFAWLAAARPANQHLLVRASRERIELASGRSLWPTLRRRPVAARLPVTVQRRPGQPERVARCAVRFGTFTLRPPLHPAPGDPPLAPLRLSAIRVDEINPPPGVEPLSWWLLTTETIETAAEAVERVEWYGLRWLVERYHYTLKSGCRLEELQLQREERLERALAVYAIVAWRLLWLTYLARQTPEAPASVALAEAEWRVLVAYFEPDGATKAMRAPPSLGQAVRWLGQLGGFLARKGDGEPGVKSLWQGFRRLQDLLLGFELAHRPRCANSYPRRSPRPATTCG